MFLIFDGECYYTAGGGHDLLYITEGRDWAAQKAREFVGQFAFTKIDPDDPNFDQYHNIEWTHVVDGTTGTILESFGGKPYDPMSGQC